jgi:hypothetical protein
MFNNLFCRFWQVINLVKKDQHSLRAALISSSSISLSSQGLTNLGLAYSQILQARIYEPLVLVNTVISWIRPADLNPCTTCTMYISLTIFLFRSGIAFYFHLFSTVQVTARPKKKCVFMITCQKNLGSVGIKKKFDYRQNRK